MPSCLALLEIANLAPALVVADRCAKAAGVEILGIESTHGAEQCLKLAGAAGAASPSAGFCSSPTGGSSVATGGVSALAGGAS